MVPAYPVYLFDIDGTLLDSARDICAAQMEVLAEAGCPPVTFEFLRNYIGLELRAVFSELLPNCTDTQMEELSQQYSTLYRGR